MTFLIRRKEKKSVSALSDPEGQTIVLVAFRHAPDSESRTLRHPSKAIRLVEGRTVSKKSLALNLFFY